MSWLKTVPGMHVLVPRIRLGATVPSLTYRQVDVLRRVVNGFTYEQAAANLEITVNTVRSHANQIFAKLGVRDQAHAVGVAFSLGTVAPDDVQWASA